jgi:hypothetical protein
MDPSANDDSDLGELLILDDLLTVRAADKIQAPLLAYPRNDHNITDFELFTAQDLDRFVDQAVKYYLHRGLLPVRDPVS